MKFSDQAKAFKKGLYKHYKRNHYKVLSIAIHEQTHEELVIYRALYGDNLIWARPISVFLELIAIDGQQVPRFRFLPQQK